MNDKGSLRMQVGERRGYLQRPPQAVLVCVDDLRVRPQDCV